LKNEKQVRDFPILPAMEVITNPEALAQFRGCAFVPTMGALHDGHLSLIRAANKTGKPVVVSIFVNPEQFAPEEDLEQYPRNLEQDCEFAKSVGANVVFAPSVETMYPSEPENIKLPSAATSPQLEDACRPTHFRGVCVAVARLFDLVQPSSTVFGLKDYQQYIVIKQLIEQEGERWGDLQIIGANIIRDDDGLAMSSRNIYLTTDQRSQSLGIHKAIRCTTEQAMIEILDDYGLEVEYAVIRDSETLLAPVEGKPTRALVAARLGHIRLIDNSAVQV
jgi:pantoate--beta-alanine ligase